MVMQMLQTARNDSPGRKARRRGGDSESSGESGGGEGGRQGGGGNSAPGSGSDRDSGASSSDGEDAGGGMVDSDEAAEGDRPTKHREWGDTRDDEEEEEEGMSVGSEDASVLQGRGKGEEARWKERYWEDGLPPLKTLDFQRRVLNREKKRKEARRDPLSASVHHAAEYYNSSEVTRLLQAARVEKKVGPGEPLWVTLPGGKERVDAGKISPGELIEAVLTNGMMLKRDEFGRVLPIKGMPRLVRRVEPLRSLLSRRVERGVDVYADGTPPPYDDEDDEKPPTGTDDEYWEEKVSPKQWWNQCGIKLNENATHVSELLDLELGPYKDAWWRSFKDGSLDPRDDEQMMNLIDWRSELQITRAPPEGKLNARFWRALERLDYDQAAKLLGEGASLEAQDDLDGMRALHKVTAWAHVEGVNQLLAAGADVNARMRGGVTALLLAAGNGFADIASILLDKGADPYVTDSRGWGVVHYAAAAGWEERETMATLLNHTLPPLAQLNFTLHAKDGRTPAQLAYRCGFEYMGEHLEALAEGRNASDTVVGRGWDNPRQVELMEGDMVFRDSDDSAHPSFPEDPHAPGYEALRNVKRKLKHVKNDLPDDLIERLSARPDWEWPDDARRRPYRTYAGVPPAPPGESPSKWREEHLAEGWKGCDWFDAYNEDDRLELLAEVAVAPAAYFSEEVYMKNRDYFEALQKTLANELKERRKRKAKGLE